MIKEEARLGRMMVLPKALQAGRANPYRKSIVRIDHWPFQARKCLIELTCHQVTVWFLQGIVSYWELSLCLLPAGWVCGSGSG